MIRLTILFAATVSGASVIVALLRGSVASKAVVPGAVVAHAC